MTKREFTGTSNLPIYWWTHSDKLNWPISVFPSSWGRQWTLPRLSSELKSTCKSKTQKNNSNLFPGARKGYCASLTVSIAIYGPWELWFTNWLQESSLSKYVQKYSKSCNTLSTSHRLYSRQKNTTVMKFVRSSTSCKHIFKNPNSDFLD